MPESEIDGASNHVRTRGRLNRPAFQLTPGDWNAFLTLGTDNLAKFLLLPVILIGTFQLAPSLVYGRILTGLAFTILIGLAIFTAMASRLSSKEGGRPVTALPYGISTPVMFVYLFSIMGPAYFATNDPLHAYRVGLGAAFIGGLIEVGGAFVGPLIQRITPRAGLLGTVAGVAIVWIAVVPITLIFANPTIGLPVLFITMLGLVGRYAFPFRLPVGLVAIGLGIALGFFTGDAAVRVNEVSLAAPVPMISDLWLGIQLVLAQPVILAVIIPIEIYNVIEAMGNVESAQAGGDEFPLRTCLLVDGFGTLLGALFGSPFPTSIYVGQPAYKEMGGKSSYALMTGVFLFAISVAGLFSFLQHLIPVAAVAPLLVFIGVVMTNYAFHAVPAGYGIAIAFALIPHIADLLKKQLDGTLLEVLQQGAVSTDLVTRLADKQAVYLDSYSLLSHGAIVTSLLWGSIVVFLIDGSLRRAMLFSFIAFALSWTGVIHADRIGFHWSAMTTGYLVLFALLGGLYLAERRRTGASVEATQAG